MPTIDHKDILDVSELAALAEECGEILEDPEEYDAADLQEARDTLTELAVFCHQLGYGYADKDDPESVRDGLDYIARNSNPLIDSDHLTGYIREDVEGSGALEGVPQYIRDNIDWDGVAEDLRSDYSSYTLDGVYYYIR